MAESVGIKVLHPGGLKSTRELSSMLGIQPDSHVLDVACGAGTTALYLADRYGCRVTGFDISDTLVEAASQNLAKHPRDGRVGFEVADANELPYPDNSFDVVVAQAFFVLVDAKERALKEIARVLRPGGCFGSLELGWLETPPPPVCEELARNTCNSIIPRVIEFDEWEYLFGCGNLTLLSTKKYPMTSSMWGMFEAEGLVNSTKVLYRMMRNQSVRKRMMTVQETFGKHHNYLGYAVSSYRKSVQG
jgi:ubiquinone/menaquinone biosynthesis C-methylase UbiE